MAKSRLDLRKEHEAAESRKTPGGDETKARKKRKTATTTARKKRTREKTVQRKRLFWGVYNSNMKLEARFAYDQRDAAEQRADQLRAKSKKLYFIQPIKEAISDAPAPEPKEKATEE
jgi:hypothetical protein